MDTLPSPIIYMKTTEKKGRGVFARRMIHKGEIVESCPVIRMPDPQWEQLEGKCALSDYYLIWGPDTAIMLGFGSIYNHSDTPNLRLDRKIEENIAVFVALRDIQPDEELLHTYRSVWFAPSVE